MDIALLSLYLKNLPDSLPFSAPDSNVNQLLHFSLDEEWVEDIGEEHTVNRSLEVALKNFGPRNDEGVFKITERGPGLEALPGVLQRWLGKYPDALLLQRWLQDSIASAKACFILHGKSLPTPDEAGSTVNAATQVIAPTGSLPKESQSKKKTTDTHKKDKSKNKPKASESGKKPDTKVLESLNDPAYDDTDEEMDTRPGGLKSEPLLTRVSKRCHPVSDPGKLMIRCVASKGCLTTWAAPRDKTRILKHSMQCGWLAHWDQDLVEGAIDVLSKKNPKVLEDLRAKFGPPPGSQSKRGHHDVDNSDTPHRYAHLDAPPLKRAKSNLSLPSTAQQPSKSSQVNKATSKHTKLSVIPSKGPLDKFRTEGKQALTDKANNALVEFIVCCGIPPHILGKEQFKNFVNILNGNYLPPSRTTFEDNLVPGFAAAVKTLVMEHLRTQTDLTITFDGGKLSRTKFWSTHITTGHRQSFCVDLDDASRLSQTGEYVHELLKKWIEKIGPRRFICACSDDTGNTHKGRYLTAEKYPWMLNLADACHNLHNSTKDICNLPAFKPVIARLRELLSFMSLSTYTRDYYDVARRELKIGRGLQSVGETRFATIYWSVDSVLQGYEAFKQIVRNPDIGIENALLHEIFDDDDLAYEFQRDLRHLGAVIMPFARAIQCLESKETTAADVYTYWLAVVAQLHDLIIKGGSKYDLTVQEDVRRIVNNRFSQLIECKKASNIYLTAFALDPSNRGASIVNNPNPLVIPRVTVNLSKDKGPAIVPTIPFIERIGVSLLGMLQNEYADEYRAGRSVADAMASLKEAGSRLAHRTPQDAMGALKKQLKAYMDGADPFMRKRRHDQSLRDWWMCLIQNDDADVLAALAVKIFSAVPISMVDERTMSTVTWINSPKRRSQTVATVANHLTIRGYTQLDDPTKNKPRKPLTVNWRDIRSTIHKPLVTPTQSSTASNLADDATHEEDTTDPPPDPECGLQWLDDGLPDLGGTEYRYFDLEAEFDIKKYLHILSDSISPDTTALTDIREPVRVQGSSVLADADTVVPKEDQWKVWA